MNGNLQCNCVDALTHLSPTVTDFNSTVLLEPNDSTIDLFETITEPAVFETKTQPNCFAGCPRSVIRRLDGFETLRCAKASIVHNLPWTPHLTWHDDVELAHGPTINAHFFCKTVNDTFHRKLCLVCTKAAECAADGVVRSNRNCFNIYVRYLIWATCVSGHTLENLHSNACVCPRIANGANMQCGEFALLVTRCFVFHRDRMTLGMH